MSMEIKKAYRISAEQNEELKRRAAESGMKESDYVRLLITQKPRDYPELRLLLTKLAYEINKIGNNVNQITHNNNSTLYNEADKMRLMAYMMKLNQMMNKAVDTIGDS